MYNGDINHSRCCRESMKKCIPDHILKDIYSGVKNVKFKCANCGEEIVAIFVRNYDVIAFEKKDTVHAKILLNNNHFGE